MAPEGGELARSCAPATHNRVPRLHTQTRPEAYSLAVESVSSLSRAPRLTCFRCTYIHADGTVSDVYSSIRITYMHSGT